MNLLKKLRQTLLRTRFGRLLRRGKRWVFRKLFVDYPEPSVQRPRIAYAGSRAALEYDARALRFVCEPDVWEERFSDGVPVLAVKDGKWEEFGHYASLFLVSRLEAGRSYQLRGKLRVRSKSEILHFRLSHSGSGRSFIIGTLNILRNNDGRGWLDFTRTFTADESFYDTVVFDAAQLRGEGNYLMVAYLTIRAL